MYTLLLSGSLRETAEYAKDHGVTFRNVKHAASAQAVQGMRPSRIIELPSFERRPDRYAIRSAIKPILARQHIEVELDETWVRPADRPGPPEPTPPPGPEELEGQVTIEEALADVEAHLEPEGESAARRSNALESREPTPPPAPEAGKREPEPKPAAKPKRKAPAKPKSRQEPTPPPPPEPAAPSSSFFTSGPA